MTVGGFAKAVVSFPLAGVVVRAAGRPVRSSPRPRGGVGEGEGRAGRRVSGRQRADPKLPANRRRLLGAQLDVVALMLKKAGQ
ncbi:hypothetical protein ACFVZN_36915 [Streptomyces virginiae]|uniref:hypothetical protein n=1 Tax=Streptomyces virginiae TaxID=1961 RepID=UPI0036A8FCD8